MGTNTALRLRRSAAQLHALAQVEREIRATDRKIRCRYLRDFADAFRSYERVLSESELAQALVSADILLVGDYHALPACQRYASSLLQNMAASGRPLVLALESVFSRHQHVLNEWMHGEIGDDELRERIRFDLDWGYDWLPYRELLAGARRHACAVYGLDCMPRADLRRIAARDRHAASKILEIRQRHPDALIIVLFGESHLAPNHLPALLRAAAPAERVLTVLQNIDPLYWRAAGEACDHVGAVRVSDDVVCVFTSTPLEKYESYRLCIERWRQGSASPDFAPSVYNLIDALLRFLNIDKYSASNGRQPKFLVDLLPEVWCRSSREQLQRLLLAKGVSEPEVGAILARVEMRGVCYVPSANAMFATDFQMEFGAEEVARFVHRACQGTWLKFEAAVPPLAPEDRFYAHVMREALAYFGSRVLYPARAPVRESDLYALYAQPREAIEGQTIQSYREYMETLDFVVLHKDYERNLRQYHHTPELIRAGRQYTGEKLEFVTAWLGQMLGSQLYDAYLAGRVRKRFLRSLFIRKLHKPGAARIAYFAAARRIRPMRRTGN